MMAVGHHEAAVAFEDGQAAFEQFDRLGAVSVRVELLGGPDDAGLQQVLHGFGQGLVP